MKKTIFCLLILTGWFSCNKTSSDSFSLEVTVERQNMEDSIIVEFSYQTIKDNDWYKVVDTTIILDGTFFFYGNIQEPTAAMLYIDNIPTRLYIEPKEMRLTIEKDYPYLYKLTGTNIETEYTELRKELLSTEKASYNILKHILKTIEEYGKSEDPVIKDSLSSDINKSIEERIAYNGKRDSVYLSFATRHRTYHIVPDLLSILSEQESISIDTIRQIYNTMPEKIKTSLMGQLANKRIEEGERKKLSMIGKITPDFTRVDLSGEVVTISDFRNRNYILLDFWASWCAPCLKAVPKMREIYNKYKDNDLIIIGISLDEDPDNWTKVIEKYKLDLWSQVLDSHKNTDTGLCEEDLSKLYNIGDRIPFYILINREGRIVARWEWLGEEEMSQINNLIMK